RDWSSDVCSSDLQSRKVHVPLFFLLFYISNKDCFRACISAGEYVRIPVAGHIARPEVDSVFIGQIQYHARTRFPAAAFYMWFIRTVGDIVYIGPESGQLIFHTIMDILQILLGHKT